MSDGPSHRDETGSHADERHESVVAVAMERHASGRAPAHERDLVAGEEPLEIQLAATPLVVLMRTPGEDEDLTLGFLLTERVIASVGQVASIHPCSVVSRPEAEGNVTRVLLREGVAVDLERLRRNLYASASCGICGKATLENVLASSPPLDDPARFAPGFFVGLPERLRAGQAGFARTGGLHAAALIAPDGSLVVLREDVGRHNAVDKVIGFAARAGRLPLAGHALLVSGRISYEIAQKALAARIPAIAAVSAPTSLAVALAEAAGIALVGFLRGGSFNVYGARERIAER